MSPVPGKGLRTPMLVSGEAADRYAELLAGLGADVAVQPGPVGTAISRKLLRSVFYKGLAAAVVEALRGAEAAGCADWLRGNIAAELAGFDERTVDRLVDGTHTHARRRADEMAAATEQLRGAGRAGPHRRGRPRPPVELRGRADAAEGDHVIIDCHGHYTTAPAAHTAWREQQVAAWEAGTTPPAYPSISDDEIRETIESSQLRLMDERGIDVTLFSPRASAMAPHVGDAAVSLEWSRRCNDLVHRVATLYPGRFVPASPSCRSRPAPTCGRRSPSCAGAWRSSASSAATSTPTPAAASGPRPPLTDRSWYPVYEAVIELDVPAMVHVSGVGHPGVPRDGRVLHQRRHDGLHAAGAGQPVR